jgi:hypothetical protein
MVRLWVGQRRNRASISGRYQRFSGLQRAQIQWPTQPNNQGAVGAHSLRIKRADRGAGHLTPSSIEVKDKCSCASTATYTFKALTSTFPSRHKTSRYIKWCRQTSSYVTLLTYKFAEMDWSRLAGYSYLLSRVCVCLRQQTAQFCNERISTDLTLVTWQSTVHEPPEDCLKNRTETCRGRFLSVFNVDFSVFKVYIVCAWVGILKK